MIRKGLATLGLAFAVVVACSAPSQEARGEEKAEGKQFSFETSCEATKAGAKSACTVSILAAKGYKWNEAFPSSFSVDTASKVAAFDKSEYDREAFEASEKKASVKLAFTGRAAGKEKVKGKASFSVCNDETCLIFRDEAVEMEVQVQ